MLLARFSISEPLKLVIIWLWLHGRDAAQTLRSAVVMKNKTEKILVVTG